MKIEDQCCSLELAKRLKELGVQQKSYFYYYLPDINCNAGLPVYYQLCDIKRIENSFFYPQEKISAFTVAELGDLLPKRISINGIYDFLTQIPSANLRYCILLYRNDFSSVEGPEIIDKKEADARAKMLIYLLENKIIKLPKEKKASDFSVPNKCPSCKEKTTAPGYFCAKCTKYSDQMNHS